MTRIENDPVEFEKTIRKVFNANLVGATVEAAAALERARAAYADDGWPVRECDRCHREYKGPAVYCSLECALEDAMGDSVPQTFSRSQWAMHWKDRQKHGEVPPTEPHWIVMRMSAFSSPREALIRTPSGALRPRMYFRHGTEAGAIAQAERLAAENPGKRFSVYASGQSFKVQKEKSNEDQNE